MNTHETIEWQGASGRNYRFTVYALDEDFGVPGDGIFIFARRAPDGWEAVMIGEGELKVEIDYLIAGHTVIDKQATHVHIRYDGAPDLRQSIVTDLLARHVEAYEPHGCNVRF